MFNLSPAPSAAPALKSTPVLTTFYITYVMLLTTATITFVEAVATHSASVRHIMNLETCISVIAAYFYSQFIQKINEGSMSYENITNMRYTDWALTTPLMLLALMLVLGHDKVPVHILPYITIIILNYVMLGIGYLGERGLMPRALASAFGFIPFVILFGIIWFKYVLPLKNPTLVFTFYAFLSIWALYGIAYLADEEVKNTTYNILDVIAKCLFGIFFWMYLTNVIVL